jgi:hypothetical protein
MAPFVRCAYRNIGLPDDVSVGVGFRTVKRP